MTHTFCEVELHSFYLSQPIQRLNIHWGLVRVIAQ